MRTVNYHYYAEDIPINLNIVYLFNTPLNWFNVATKQETWIFNYLVSAAASVKKRFKGNRFKSKIYNKYNEWKLECISFCIELLSVWQALIALSLQHQQEYMKVHSI